MEQMSLTNYLLFLILVTLSTYTFMPWEGMAKGTWNTLISYWIGFFIFFAAGIGILYYFNLIA